MTLLPDAKDRIAHLSDLHFGTESLVMTKALLEDLEALKVDFIVISGDLTQRARSREFARARAFLEALPAPWIAVPGNHDLAPFYKPLRRFWAPLKAFDQWLHDREKIVKGRHSLFIALDSARAFRFAGGRPKKRQLALLKTLPQSQDIPILIFHHPLSSWFRVRAGLRKAWQKYPLLAEIQSLDTEAACHGQRHHRIAPYLFLCGHHHVPKAEFLSPDPQSPLVSSGKALLVTAGTALSSRQRGAGNSYNLLDLTRDRLRLHVRQWTGMRFESHCDQDFKIENGYWSK